MSPDNHHPRKTRNKKGSSNAPEFRFINHDLTAEHKAELASYLEAHEWDLGTIAEVVAEGYSFKLAPDSRGGGFRAHLIDTVSGSAYENACISGRGSTPTAALYALFYRHFVLAPDNWSMLDSGIGPGDLFG